MDGVLQTQPDGAVLAANPAACAMLGLSEAQLRQRGGETPSPTAPTRACLLQAERSRNGRARGEVRMIRADGSRFDAEISSTVYRNRDGDLLSSVVFRDVTERQVWARRLEDSLKLLNDLAQRVPGVIYQYRLFPDGRSCFPFASQGLWAIYEVRPEEVIDDATAVLRRLHPDDEPAVMASIRESADTLLPWQAEYRVVLPEQGVRWRRGEARPETLPDGSVLWHGYISDITDRKQTEGDLRASLERFRLAASTGNVWAWREGDTLDVPPSLRQLFKEAGAQSGPSLVSWLPAVHEQDQDRLREAIRNHLKNRVPLDIEFQTQAPLHQAAGCTCAVNRCGTPRAASCRWPARSSMSPTSCVPNETCSSASSSSRALSTPPWTRSSPSMPASAFACSIMLRARCSGSTRPRRSASR